MFRPTLFALAMIASAPVLAQATGETTILRTKVVADGDAEFARVDTNKDGKMSRAEIETVQRTALTTRITARNKAMFAELDSDKNGQINASEFAKATPIPKADATEVPSLSWTPETRLSPRKLLTPVPSRRSTP